MDEHRLGLKPILGRRWAHRGKRPIVRVQHRYEWLYPQEQTGQNCEDLLANLLPLGVKAA